eukprot:gene24571-31361_t
MRRSSIEDAEEKLLGGGSSSEDDDDSLLATPTGPTPTNVRRRRRKLSEPAEATPELDIYAAAKLVHKNFASLNYEPDETEVWRHHEAKRHYVDGARWFNAHRRTNVKRWLLLASTGAITAILGLLANVASQKLAGAKF